MNGVLSVTHWLTKKKVRKVVYSFEVELDLQWLLFHFQVTHAFICAVGCACFSVPFRVDPSKGDSFFIFIDSLWIWRWHGRQRWEPLSSPTTGEIHGEWQHFQQVRKPQTASVCYFGSLCVDFEEAGCWCVCACAARGKSSVNIVSCL